MPLPSVLKGASQCQVLTKRTKQRCKNPAAYSCKACRSHGAHRSRNVLKDANHPRYKNGGRSKAVEAELRKKSILLKYLVDIGNHVELFYKQFKIKGRPPLGYTQLDLKDPDQLALAIMRTLSAK